MAEPFLGEIKMFGGNFAPRGYAFCNGQLLPISQNSALFSLLGTIYGGDGRTTFGLPDLRGRAALHFGQGPGLSNWRTGERGGEERVTLTTMNLPQHHHSLTPVTMKLGENANKAGGSGKYLAKRTTVSSGGTSVGDFNFSETDSGATLAGDAINQGTTTATAGGSQAFGITQPSLAINYIIALQGLFPSRS